MSLPHFKASLSKTELASPYFASLFFIDLDFTYSNEVTEYMKENAVAYDLSSGSIKLIFNMNEGLSLADMIYASQFIYRMTIKTHNKKGDILFVNQLSDVKYKDFNFKQDLRDDNICYLEITFNYPSGWQLK